MVLECRPHPGCRLGACQTWYQSTEFKNPRDSMRPYVLSPSYRCELRHIYN
ncbi:hypothetical protein MTR67_018940 [Solanum verrucosum]|uniref:Uncharacterized protein n=1 Tax=Solanum verrucosum TaxID=315347 RepID=A0AAF0TTG0_SOLVR|nr:hypothetical protein MTR67_018940 [Solanum verrucosum]